MDVRLPVPLNVAVGGTVTERLPDAEQDQAWLRDPVGLRLADAVVVRVGTWLLERLRVGLVEGVGDGGDRLRVELLLPVPLREAVGPTVALQLGDALGLRLGLGLELVEAVAVRVRLQV